MSGDSHGESYASCGSHCSAIVVGLLAGLSITPPGSFSEKEGAPMPTAAAGTGAATTEEEVEKMRGALDRMKFSFTSYSHEVMQELRDGRCFALSTNQYVFVYIAGADCSGPLSKCPSPVVAIADLRSIDDMRLGTVVNRGVWC